jgi:hypothetical protein
MIECQRNNFKTFTKQSELYVVGTPGFCLFFFVLLTLPSLFSYPYSYPLHVSCSSCATIHSSPSQLLVLLLLIHSVPIFASPCYPSPTCHHIAPPSYTLTTHWLAYYTKHTHHWPPAIPITSTFQYNWKYTSTHTCETKPSRPYTSSPTHPLYFPPF